MGGQRVMGPSTRPRLARRSPERRPWPRISPPVRPTPRRHLPQLSPFPGRAATSRCLAVSLTRHRHILAEPHRHRASHQARRPSGEYGASRRGGPATPSTMPATDTIPSFAPSTAARGQLSRLDNPPLWRSTAWRESRFRAASPGNPTGAEIAYRQPMCDAQPDLRTVPLAS